MENTTNRQVGARIAKARVAMALTQAELASEMSALLGREIRPLTVTRMEGGKRPIVVDELVAAADALKIGPEDLLTDTDLPIGSIRIVGAYQAVLRASSVLRDSVQQYISSHNDLHRILAEVGDKYLDRLPAVTKVFIEATNDWTVEFIVSEAQKGGGFDEGTTA